MTRKVPAAAFEHYVALGPSRSYAAVAKHYGVCKRTVLNHANKENWQASLVELERKARERGVEKILETLEDMNERHLKTMQLVQRKALEALRSLPLSSAMDAVRALSISVEKERLIRGEPTDRGALDIEAVIRREFANWMTHDKDDGDGEAAE